MAKKKATSQTPIRLDFGCGPSKKADHIGIDTIAFPGVDLVLDLSTEPLPYKDNTVEAIWASHCVEHLDPKGRCWMLNEAYRVLKPGGQMTITVPHWSSSRAYGDPTHQWPGIGEMWFMYLNREWREKEAPHTDAKHLKWGYACDFEATWGYALNPSLLSRSDEFKQFATVHYREAVYDVQATLTAKK